MTNGRRRPDPSDLSIRDAIDRYLRNRRADATDASIESWGYRLKIFAEWFESVGLETVGDLEQFDLVDYFEQRSAQISPATLEGEMWTLRMFIEFLGDLGAVDSDLYESVRIPDIDEDERTNDKKLDTEAALALLRYYRDTPAAYGTRQHVFLELAWVTGARQGGLRALDLQDVDLDGDPWIEFRHRPDADTPLKNKLRGERPVALPDETAEALRRYIDYHRIDVPDDDGRQPLLAGMRGRPAANTVRNWSYLATQPCLHGPCPHGKDPETCEWTTFHHSSKCPSSRSPHQIRTGAITWMLNLGWPAQDVAERVNSDTKTIEQHYDKADVEARRLRQRDRMEDRRRSLVNDLDLTNDNDTDT